MSDEHHEHDGGHELEAIDAGQLFRLVGGLTIVVFISIIAVIQWFHKQQEELRVTRSDYTFLQEHQAREAEMLEGIRGVSDKVAADASLLKAPAAPAGWIHPDDIGGGAAPAAMPAAGGDKPAEAPAEKPAEEGAAEGEEAPADAAEGDKEADGEGAEGDAAPADEKPAAEEKPAEGEKEKAPAKAADGE